MRSTQKLSATHALKWAREQHSMVQIGCRQYQILDYDQSRGLWDTSMSSYSYHQAMSANAASVASTAARVYLESRGYAVDGQRWLYMGYRAGNLSGSARQRLRILIDEHEPKAG